MTNEELVKEIQNGNELLKEELYKNIKSLIYKTVNDFYNNNRVLLKKCSIDYDDAIQLAQIAFLKSIGCYKENVAKFSTYVVYRIQLHLHNKIYPNKKINKSFRIDLEKISLDNDDFHENLKEYKALTTDNRDKIDNKIYIEHLMKILTTEEKSIILDFYINGLDAKDMVNKYGLTLTQIRNIKNKAIQKMRRYGGKYDIC